MVGLLEYWHKQYHTLLMIFNLSFTFSLSSNFGTVKLSTCGAPVELYVGAGKALLLYYMES